MTVSFCPTCATDVQDVGGFCLLGHRLGLRPDDPIAQLRAEVDHAFEKVEGQIAAALDPLAELAAENGIGAAEALAIAGGDSADDRTVLEEMRVTSKAVWKPLEEETTVTGNDPIVAFAPAPRMDWGPERSRRKRRSGFRRARTA